jgi:drug/metabolite transporter (DMT)-like permease
MARSDNSTGVIAMLLAVGLLALMDAGLKALAAHYPPLQVAALRGLVALPLVCAYVAWRKAGPSLLRVRWPLHILRGALSVGMLGLFAYALKRMPLTEAYTLIFVAPLMITALSGPVLGEKVGALRWSMIALGFAGVLVVLRPTGASVISLAGLAVLAAAAAYAVSAVTVRVLGRTDSSESMVFWMTGMLAVGAGLLAAPNWVALRAADAPVLAVIAVTGFLGQLAITEAFKRAEASLIAPLEYTALAWGAGLDYFFWHTLPDAVTLVGAAIIIASGLVLLRRETVHVEAEHP